MIAGFGFKISSVPFQFWAPDVYEGAPTPVTAFLSVASKAAGFAVILRVFYISFPVGVLSDNWATIFAALSVLVHDVRQPGRHSPEQHQADARIQHGRPRGIRDGRPGGGRIWVPCPAKLDVGPSGVLFYLGGYVATNLMAFAAIVAVSNRIDSDKIDDYAGMSRRAPFVAATMAFAMISLTGIPPTIGFMSKVYLFGAAVNADLEWLAIAGMVNSVISAYYYLRVVKVMYLQDPPDKSSVTTDTATGVVLAATAAATFVFGVYPTPLINLARSAVGVLGV